MQALYVHYSGFYPFLLSSLYFFLLHVLLIVLYCFYLRTFDAFCDEIIAFVFQSVMPNVKRVMSENFLSPIQNWLNGGFGVRGQGA